MEILRVEPYSLAQIWAGESSGTGMDADVRGGKPVECSAGSSICERQRRSRQLENYEPFRIRSR
jgi:hypothetical protein